MNTNIHLSLLVITFGLCVFSQGKPHFISEPMNTETTIKSFDEVLLPLYNLEKKTTTGVVCQGDNARPHSSKHSIDWFDDKHVSRVGFGGKPLSEKGGHPANSPDLNPIELLFNILDEQVSKRQPKTVVELIKYSNEVWSNISIETVRKCYDRYPTVITHLRQHNYEEYHK
jgi:hypothetical protein